MARKIDQSYAARAAGRSIDQVRENYTETFMQNARLVNLDTGRGLLITQNQKAWCLIQSETGAFTVEEDGDGDLICGDEDFRKASRMIRGSLEAL